MIVNVCTTLNKIIRPEFHQERVSVKLLIRTNKLEVNTGTHQLLAQKAEHLSLYLK